MKRSYLFTQQEGTINFLGSCILFTTSSFESNFRFNRSADVVRLPYLQQLLHLAQMDLYSASVEILLNYQDDAMQLQHVTKERVLHLCEVSYPHKDSPYYSLTKDYELYLIN